MFTSAFRLLPVLCLLAFLAGGCKTPYATYQASAPIQYTRPMTMPLMSPNVLEASAKPDALPISHPVAASYGNIVILPAGAQISVQLTQPVNSQYVQPGQLIPVRVVTDVTVKKVRVIKAGASGMATVLSVEKGKIPSVSIAMNSVQAVDGQQVAVTSGQIRAEGRKGGTATGGWIGFSIFALFGLLAVIGGEVSGGLLFIAIGSLFGLIKKPAIPAEINVGTTLSGTTASEVEIEID
jgi:hypothetical protein